MAAMRRVLDSCAIAIPVIYDQLSNYKTIIDLREAQIDLRDKTITDAQKVIVHRERQIVRLKWHKAAIGAAGFLATGFMTYLYATKK